MNKWDVILVTAFLSIAAISFIGYRIIHQAPAVTVEISSFGQVVETVDISRDGTYEIPYIGLEPISVNEDNMNEVIIGSGFHLKEDVYLNVPGKMPE